MRRSVSAAIPGRRVIAPVLARSWPCVGGLSDRRPPWSGLCQASDGFFGDPWACGRGPPLPPRALRCRAAGQSSCLQDAGRQRRRRRSTIDGARRWRRGDCGRGPTPIPAVIRPSFYSLMVYSLSALSGSAEDGEPKRRPERQRQRPALNCPSDVARRRWGSDDGAKATSTPERHQAGASAAAGQDS
jgi:hypothetical protein